MGKKDIVLKKNRNSLYLIGIIVVLIIVIAILMIPGKKNEQATIESNSKALKEILSKNESPQSTVINHEIVKSENGEIIFPVISFDDKAQYFEYEGVQFFILKSNDGTIRAAFDACDVCGGSQGYEQKGTDIECRKCGKVFKIDELNTKNKGYGCWPSYLPHKIEGNNVVFVCADADDFYDKLGVCDCSENAYYAFKQKDEKCDDLPNSAFTREAGDYNRIYGMKFTLEGAASDTKNLCVKLEDKQGLLSEPYDTWKYIRN